MQCPNCRFENMPGINHCGRCGASLRLAAATIDVHPPRAGKWAKRLRRFSPGRRGYQARDLLNASIPRISPSDGIDVPEAPLLMRLVVPGWAQLYLGRRVLGGLFLGSFLLLALLAVAFFGTPFGSMMLGLAVACHISSIIDVVNHASESLAQRIAIALTCAATVAMVVYFPAGWLVSRLAVPQVMVRNVPPFEAGDVVLYAPGLLGRPTLGPGDVVLYSPEQVNTAPRGHTQHIVRGDRIDRILAGPGQTASWNNGRLEIDGQFSALTPLNPLGCPYSIKVAVPEGSFLILPSSLDATIVGSLDGGGLQRLALVSRSQVRGWVFLRHQPFSRFGWIR